MYQVLALCSFFTGWAFASWLQALRKTLRRQPCQRDVIESVIMSLAAASIWAGFA